MTLHKTCTLHLHVWGEDIPIFYLFYFILLGFAAIHCFKEIVLGYLCCKHQPGTGQKLPYSSVEISKHDNSQNRMIRSLEDKWRSSGWPDSGNESCGIYYKYVQTENMLSEGIVFYLTFSPGLTRKKSFEHHLVVLMHKQGKIWSGLLVLDNALLCLYERFGSFLIPGLSWDLGKVMCLDIREDVMLYA